MTMREEFEQWMSDEGQWPAAVEKTGAEYKLSTAATGWTVWQAAYAAGQRAEREACAVTAWNTGMDLHMKQSDAREIGSLCAAAIRNRKEQG
ncbi:hypothetical protein [Xenophilus sp. Marseille-Q4582]|uniref:hypothetical protein n=1 Tax=Xenophilus sp. Marseille-Q4582 TaxID=2866600 RepID=UPI001CE4992D|nr:hypothetical protein [Xenophilus sp. Marseille-Q4582]